jgi:spore coat protein U-like protein
VFAASQSSNLSVTANVSANCTISTTPVAFGAYDPVATNNTTGVDASASGTVVVACTKNTAATIDLGNGGNFSGTRRMSSGSDFLGYSLYSDAAHTSAWGSGASSVAYNAASKNAATLDVYGLSPKGQDVSVGAYSDTVVATINY